MNAHVEYQLGKLSDDSKSLLHTIELNIDLQISRLTNEKSHTSQ